MKMKTHEIITAPIGAITSILSITAENLDSAEKWVALVVGVLCAARSAWLILKPALAKLWAAIKAHYNKKEGGNGND